MKHVDHEIHEVEQHPATAAQSFDMVSPVSCFGHGFNDPFSKSPDVRIRRSAGDHEIIGCLTQTANVEHDHILCLVRIQRLNCRLEFAFCGNGISPSYHNNGHFEGWFTLILGPW